METNEDIDLIVNHPKKAINNLAVPIFLTNLFLLMNNFTSGIWVAGLGADALTAVGFISPIFLIILGFANGLGAGSNSIISRHIGAKKYDAAGNSAIHSIMLSIIFSIITTIILSLVLKPLLYTMGAGEVINDAFTYGYIMILGCFSIFIPAMMTAIFRSEGKIKRATYPLMLGSFINMILDPIFIYVLNFGIAGAAWATVISSTLSCVVMSYWIWGKKDLYLDLSPKNFDFNGKMMIDILQVAIPSTLELIVFSALAVIINSFLVQASGTQAVAVYTASMRIVQLAMIPLMGIGTAVLTVSGIAYGAHNYKNLQTAHSYSIKLGFIISIAIGILMFLFASQIAGVFSYTEASAGLSGEIASAISVLSLFVLAIPHGIMSSMMFQGVGKGTYSLLVTLLRSLILESLFAYMFCFTFGWGVAGIYGGVVFGCFVGGTIGYIWAKFFIRKFKEISIRKYASKNE